MYLAHVLVRVCAPYLLTKITQNSPGFWALRSTFNRVENSITFGRKECRKPSVLTLDLPMSVALRWVERSWLWLQAWGCEAARLDVERHFWRNEVMKNEVLSLSHLRAFSPHLLITKSLSWSILEWKRNMSVCSKTGCICDIVYTISALCQFGGTKEHNWYSQCKLLQPPYCRLWKWSFYLIYCSIGGQGGIYYF